VEEWIGIHGSIASGKSTLMRRIKHYIRANRMDATDPAHIDPSQPNKVYVLLVKEPVKEWKTPRFRLPPKVDNNRPVNQSASDTTDIGGSEDSDEASVPQSTSVSDDANAEELQIGDAEESANRSDGRLYSMLEIFYNDIAGMGFEFQVYVFNSRLEQLMLRLDAIAPSDFPRRIVIISERTMISDRVFYHTVARLNSDCGVPNAEPRLFIYNKFSATTCDDVLGREKRMIYVPTSPLVCGARQKSRDREGEHCSADYLQRLENEHSDMVRRFSEENGPRAVLRLDRFDSHLSEQEIDAEVCDVMSQLFSC
jgi:deoxyadenosine/deoxycytidine kinase